MKKAKMSLWVALPVLLAIAGTVLYFSGGSAARGRSVGRAGIPEVKGSRKDPEVEAGRMEWERFSSLDVRIEGCGVVVGLDGRGDSATSYATTKKILSHMKIDPGVLSDPAMVGPGNIALVRVEAVCRQVVEYNAYNVRVFSIRDAASLEGGRLLPVNLCYSASKQMPCWVGGVLHHNSKDEHTFDLQRIYPDNSQGKLIEAVMRTVEKTGKAASEVFEQNP